MAALQTYSLQQIEQRLGENCLPFSGITELGSAEFHLLKPCSCAAVVMHTGSRIRPELMEAMVVEQEDRFREEDPYADVFVRDLPIRIIARDSRFEYDLNRVRRMCIYPYGEKKFGMDVWKRELEEQEKAPALYKHQEFHNLVDLVMKFLLKKMRFVVVFDMHTYCYQRNSKPEWYEDPNPEINLGTRAVNRKLFGEVIHTFMNNLKGQTINNHIVRVEENRVFKGGYLSRRLSRKWHDEVLVMAIEYKKIFMNEWSGEVYPDVLASLVEHFDSAARKLIRSTRRLSRSLPPIQHS
jgi:hypothetical protein